MTSGAYERHLPAGARQPGVLVGAPGEVVRLGRRVVPRGVEQPALDLLLQRNRETRALWSTQKKRGLD